MTRREHLRAYLVEAVCEAVRRGGGAVATGAAIDQALKHVLATLPAEALEEAGEVAKEVLAQFANEGMAFGADWFLRKGKEIITDFLGDPGTDKAAYGAGARAGARAGAKDRSRAKDNRKTVGEALMKMGKK